MGILITPQLLRKLNLSLAILTLITITSLSIDLFKTHCESKSFGQLDEGICLYYDYSEFFPGYESKTNSFRSFANN